MTPIQLFHFSRLYFRKSFIFLNQFFSNKFVELHEELNGKKVSYKKKYYACCYGSIKTTISYLTPRLERMSYDEDEKIVRDVYDSVIDNFGIDFSTNSTKCMMSSYFISIRDESRYQSANSSGTYGSIKYGLNERFGF